MSDLPEPRKGDRIRITLDGTVTSDGIRVGGVAWRSMDLAADGDKSSVSVHWDSETVLPEIEVLSTTYTPGDVALIYIGGGVELLMFRVESKGEGAYWMQPTGRKWREEFAPGYVTILHRADEMIKKAP